VPENQDAISFNVLFLCTGNSARFLASRGYSQPEWQTEFHRLQRRQLSTGRVNPFALKQLEQRAFHFQFAKQGWDNSPSPARSR
jgi:hypothetical protein